MAETFGGVSVFDQMQKKTTRGCVLQGLLFVAWRVFDWGVDDSSLFLEFESFDQMAFVSLVSNLVALSSSLLLLAVPSLAQPSKLSSLLSQILTPPLKAIKTFSNTERAPRWTSSPPARIDCEELASRGEKAAAEGESGQGSKRFIGEMIFLKRLRVLRVLFMALFAGFGLDFLGGLLLI